MSATDPLSLNVVQNLGIPDSAVLVGVTMGEVRRLLATPNLDVGQLAAINDAQVDPSELRLGHDLTPVAERIAKAYGRTG